MKTLMWVSGFRSVPLLKVTCLKSKSQLPLEGKITSRYVQTLCGYFGSMMPWLGGVL